MPELPEVQTIVADLQFLTGDTITGFWTDSEKALNFENKKSSSKEFSKYLKEKKIQKIWRRGKYIFFDLSGNISLIIHLRMTGQLRLNVQENKHAHHIFYLKKNNSLFFVDMRKFGTITLVATENIPSLKNITTLGIDPFDEKFNENIFQKIINSKKNHQIKEILIDQSKIAGIGNIYASEILFDAKIMPNRLAGSLAKTEFHVLCKSLKKILQKAITLRGTSVSDYLDSSGKRAFFKTN